MQLADAVKAWIRRLSLARKLTAMGILTSFVSLAIATGVPVAYDRASSKQDMLVDTQVLANLIASTSTADLSFRDSKAASETLNGLSTNQDIISAAILLNDGAVLAHYEHPGTPVRHTFDGTTVRTHQPWHLFGRDTMQLTQPITLDGETIGTVYLDSTFGEVQKRSMAFVRIVAVVLLGASIVTWILASRLQRIISVPLVRLAEVARAVTREPY